MGGAGRIGALVGWLVIGGCTWIPLDGPLGRNKPGGGDADTDADVDTDTGSEPETGGTGDTGIETDPGTVDGEFDLANARALFVGEAPGDHATASFATGELTGDGVTDLVIGSWWWDTNENGSVYVASTDAVGRVSLSDVEARRTGGGAVQLVGCSVSVGDLDNDHLDDLLIGAADTAFIVRGPVSGIAQAEDAALVRFERGAGPDEVCFEMVAAGDIDTDGDEDVLIGFESDDQNLVAGFVGDASGPESVDLDDLPNRIEGFAQNMGVLTSADVDGDGVQDVMLGDHTPNDFAGTLRVFHGPIIGSVSIDAADAVLSGAEAYTSFGVVSANAGDVNGDGRDDLLVGAPAGSQEPPKPGSAFLWTTEMAGAQPAYSADAIFVGVEPYSEVGIGMTAGDVDGDGESDIVLGAPLIGFGSVEFGLGGAYLLHGPFSGSVDFENAIIIRGAASEPVGLVGFPVSTIGDLDGDGLDDLAVMGSGIEQESGGTYLVFGGDLL